MKIKSNKAIKLLKDFWRSDLDIEIDTVSPKGVLIFAPIGEWDFSGDSPEWNPKRNEYGEIIRRLAEPDEEYASLDFFITMSEQFDKYFTLDEAIEMIKNIENY